MTEANTPFCSRIEDLLLKLPAAKRIQNTPSGGEATCVVAIAGFERRCVSAVEALRNKGWRSEHGLCIQYINGEMVAPNSKHSEQLRMELSEISGGRNPEVLEHDDHSVQTDFGVSLLAKLAEMGVDCSVNESHIVFDITVGSSRLLLEGLHALLSSGVRLTILYTESGKYRPTFDEYVQHREEQVVRHIDPAEFLTHGVDRVELVKAIPGQSADSRPTYLVVFPAFAFSRVSAVIDELAPSRVHWVFGIPHLVENRWRIDAQKEYHAGLVERMHRHCYVSTFDYRETLQVLERVYHKRRMTYGIMIASLGSKMQKVGQVLFHTLRPEVAAVVSIPKAWDDNKYSDETPVAVYALDFGNCAALRETLWDVRRLRR